MRKFANGSVHYKEGEEDIDDTIKIGDIEIPRGRQAVVVRTKRGWW